MNIQDFSKYNIINFTPQEIYRTGASLDDIKIELLIKLQKYRSLICRRVNIVFNGLTTGKHKSPEHSGGIASDIYHQPTEGIIDFKKCYYTSLESGFTGIGVYYNEQLNLYLFHMDCGPRFRSWSAYKKKKHEKWKYKSLLRDPKNLKFD